MTRNLLAKLELLLIILLACVPLLIRFPYRVNIFLSWEGAYRISEGQLPFRDFGTPLGGMYWVIPAFFFKIFGPKMITLVKAQVFINILAGLSFRSILKSLSVNKGIRFAAVLLFCISFSFFNFWPWYNHSVIVYELIALAFLFKYIGGTFTGTNKGAKPFAFGWLIAAALFVCFSFLTKQDGGGLAFLIGCGLLASYGWLEKKGLPLVIFAGSCAVFLSLIVLVFSKWGFGYWFNHGQAPHTARISLPDIAEEFFGASQWIKFYLFLTLMLAVIRYNQPGGLSKNLLADKKGLLLLLLTWAILAESAIFQVTSYTPPDNNIFFHAFAIACIFSQLSGIMPVNFGKPAVLAFLVGGILFWWSGTYWKYVERVLPHGKTAPSGETAGVTGSGPATGASSGLQFSPTGENVVNKHTYMINRDTGNRDVPMEEWIETGLPTFDRIKMPPPTVAGIHRLMEMDIVKDAHSQQSPLKMGGKGGNSGGEGLRVLNMSELTPLAAEIPFALEKNQELPLWYHLGVGMFNRQAELLEKRIGAHYYDLVLFEYVSNLNNFYAFRVRDSLRVHYKLVDSFMAPRRGETQGNIEVYRRPVDSLRTSALNAK
ncbi:hypothetical protein ACX0G9_08620 [Flavitalea flava]